MEVIRQFSMLLFILLFSPKNTVRRTLDFRVEILHLSCIYRPRGLSIERNQGGKGHPGTGKVDARDH